MNLHQNHFELFGLPARFAVDAAALEARYRELQREVHPDRFAAAPEMRLRGVDPQFETNTAMPSEFLVEQMSWRERIEAGSENPEALARLRGGLREESAKIYEKLRGQLDQGGDDEAASEATRMLMFYEKLADEIDDKLAELET